MIKDFREEEAFFAAENLKALAHPLRLRILDLLTRGEMHVSALAETLGVTQSTVSQQLRILRSRELVGGRTAGGHAYYRITEPHVLRMMECIESRIAQRRKP